MLCTYSLIYFNIYYLFNYLIFFFPGTHGPGYASPLDAFKNGSREELLYVICVQPDQTKQDYLATVDVDPKSSTYSQVSVYWSANFFCL